MTGKLWPPPQRVALAATGRVPARAAHVTVGVAGLPSQGYRLRITADAVTIDAADAAGARHGKATLRQLLALHAGELPIGSIEDWPAIETRGVMLDVSRSRVPTLDTLRDLIDRLASLKINHFELYIEHTFAYAGHEEVWADSSPYTADELRELDSHAAALGVELSANQNCLGHMERWLRHPRYLPLALEPDGFVAPWGATVPPMTMDPANPDTLALTRDLLGQLLPALRSTRAHVGLDEPWELPAERAPDWLAYLKSLRSAPETANHDLLVWADIPSRHPELLAALPTGVTLCEWGYEASHPFAERAAALAATNTPFWLCPGTSSWNSIGGRWTNAVDNIAAAASAAADSGATGLLVTDWGDNGHLQHLTIAEPQMAWAAGCAWNPSAARAGDLAAVVDQWVVNDSSVGFGAALQALGNSHLTVAPQLFNQSILVAHLYRPEVRLGSSKRTTGLTDDDLAQAGEAIERGHQGIVASALGRSDGEAVRDEAAATATLLALLVDDARARLAGDGTLASVIEATRHSLAERLTALTAEHRRLWLNRARPGGLAESVAVLERLGIAYLSAD